MRTLPLLTLLLAPFAWAQDDAVSMKIAERVQREIARLDNFGVFDEIDFTVKGSTVTLTGLASRPTLKDSAERVTKKVEGVEKVVNQIEVAPLSPNDDSIRLRTYIAIYGHPTLARLNPNRGVPWLGTLAQRAGGITNDPPLGPHPIHILVKNGDVTLRGYLTSAAEKNIAGIQANGVPGVFSVKNEIAVAVSELRKMRK
ncbi:MAG: BON domain-containing protein [Acidobacteria bacterium]|nr:BON domain-containing protein [Acidobacteriota bacterium]